jgi:hypothetical protein
MAGSPTLRVLAAHIGQAAHVHAFVAHTGAVGGAVSIAHALKWNAAHAGVSLGACWTGAHGIVIGWHTDCVSATRARYLTRVLTLAIVAGRCGRTVNIRQTLVRRAAPAASIAISHSAWRTFALVGPNSINTQGCRLTGAVLTLVNVHTLVN